MTEKKGIRKLEKTVTTHGGGESSCRGEELLFVRSEPEHQIDLDSMLFSDPPATQKVVLEGNNIEPADAKKDLQALLDKYTDLFDFAPVGYFILDSNGVVISVNHAGSRLLGMERSRLSGLNIIGFISAVARPAFSVFLAKVFGSQVKETCEVAVLKEDNCQLFVWVEAVADAARAECRLALIDITERTRAPEYLKKEKEAIQALQKLGEVVKGLRKVGETALLGISSITPDRPASSSFKPGSSISNREFQVLQLLVEGYCTKEIASLLGISSKTVEMHRIHMMKKLEITNLVSLVKFAIREGICDTY
jgi:PAS domain S-box-containing protein